MQTVIYAATKYGYAVQVVDGNGIDYEYTAGNHQLESQAVTAPRSHNSVKLSQLRRWASRRRTRLQRNEAFRRIGLSTMPTWKPV